jgi:glycosyltransferase involved in cell wall biosynthesis
MPAYNAAATLAAALESLRVQTLDGFEVVAVDDGSNDDTGRILEAWQPLEPRLRPFRLAHQGLIGALNHGLQQCRGRYIARMDADDLCHPHRLQEQVRLLEEHPEVSVAGSLVETFPREQVGQGFRLYEEWLNRLVTDADIRREIFIESPIPHPSAMLRRQEILELGGYEERGWPEDYDLWLRYAAAGRVFAKVPQVLLYWREHPARLTHTDSRYSVENFLRAKAHCQRGRAAAPVAAGAAPPAAGRGVLARGPRPDPPGNGAPGSGGGNGLPVCGVRRRAAPGYQPGRLPDSPGCGRPDPPTTRKEPT